MYIHTQGHRRKNKNSKLFTVLMKEYMYIYIYIYIHVYTHTGSQAQEQGQQAVHSAHEGVREQEEVDPHRHTAPK